MGAGARSGEGTEPTETRDTVTIHSSTVCRSRSVFVDRANFFISFRYSLYNFSFFPSAVGGFFFFFFVFFFVLIERLQCARAEKKQTFPDIFACIIGVSLEI